MLTEEAIKRRVNNAVARAVARVQSLTMEKTRETDFIAFARNALNILTKESQIKQFTLNHGQSLFHSFVEQNKREGINKFVIVKARQLGITTYIVNRLLHKVITNPMKHALILSHESMSTEHIFGILKFAYTNIPPNYYRPNSVKNNQNELILNNGSSVKVATAGGTRLGRSTTTNFIHMSEVAFYKDSSFLVASTLQSFVNNKDDELFLESTANGMGTLFHQKAIDGLDPKSEYRTFFLAWNQQKEYATPILPFDEFKLTEEEQELKKLYNLTDEQLNWRRTKIREFKGFEWAFKQEYPLNITEAFEASLVSMEKLIPYEFIERASKQTDIYVPQHAPIIVGVDPARNNDRAVICIRQGRKILRMHVFELSKGNEMWQTEMAGNLIRIIESMNPVKVFIDFGLGYGIVDILRERNIHFKQVVKGISFGGKAIKDDVYNNKRTEMYGDMRDWFMQEGGVKIPNNEKLKIELSTIPMFKRNSSGQFAMLDKEQIKKMFH
jgi:hypothetical protein